MSWSTMLLPMSTIRLKITDRCAWNCWWCHNEGTGSRDPFGVPDLAWDAATEEALTHVAEALGLTEVHLTGGEPMIHPQLPDLVARLRQTGFTVKATTVGCDESMLTDAVKSGLGWLLPTLTDRAPFL